MDRGKIPRDLSHQRSRYTQVLLIGTGRLTPNTAETHTATSHHP